MPHTSSYPGPPGLKHELIRNRVLAVGSGVASELVRGSALDPTPISALTGWVGA
jgi:hypothetical protein